MANYDLYAVGAALVDAEFRVDDAWLAQAGIDKGLMTLVDIDAQRAALARLAQRETLAVRACGGSAANTAIANSAMGGSSFLACAVADDDDGRFYLEELARAQVGCNARLAQSPGVTGRCLVLVSPDAERSMLTYLGASASLAARQLDDAALADSAMVYLEGYLVATPDGLATALRAAELARATGIRTALSLSDPNIVAYCRDALAELAGAGLDWLFCNEDEACLWANGASWPAAREALEPLAAQIAVTRGADGVALWESRRWSHIDAHPVEAVDTNGAGDMFAGALLRALACGHAPLRAAGFAARAAAEVVVHYGPRLPLPRYRALAAEL